MTVCMRFLSLMITLSLLFCAGICAAEEVVLVVNPENPVASVTPREVKNIFLGKKNSWDDGSYVLPVLQKDENLTVAFTMTMLKRSVQQFKLYWRKQVFSGKRAPLIQVEDSVQVKAMIASRAGGIGYILASEIDSSVRRLEVKSR